MPFGLQATVRAFAVLLSLLLLYLSLLVCHMLQHATTSYVFLCFYVLVCISCFPPLALPAVGSGNDLDIVLALEAVVQSLLCGWTKSVMRCGYLDSTKQLGV